ncbi:hypothetical protein [Nocardia australiensis]|uniref:hypothetical protein n=1 Tax=Nocardia australiensis TaxID=2887191 RepID=UPI001D14F193|nr:hypothetical protein [Nocardia australiensis]
MQSNPDVMVVSWRTILNDEFPEDAYEPHNDSSAQPMHQIRGYVMAQAGETEAVIGQALRHFEPSANLDRSAGRLLHDLKAAAKKNGFIEYGDEFELITKALKRRNAVVHADVQICSTWVPYATGGGEWQEVMYLLGREESDERRLWDDLELQQEATIAAVRILHALSVRARPRNSTDDIVK